MIGNPNHDFGKELNMRPSPEDDTELVTRSVDTPDLFTAIFERHYGAVSSFLIRRFGQSLGEELAAETFVTAFRKRERFDPDRGAVRAWIFGIASNLARKHWRREKRELKAYARTGVAPDPGSEVQDTIDRVDALARSRPIARALAELRHDEREALFLFYWADLTYDEISVEQNCAVGTVRSRLSRARARIREELNTDSRPVTQPSAAPEGACNG